MITVFCQLFPHLGISFVVITLEIYGYVPLPMIKLIIKDL